MKWIVTGGMALAAGAVYGQVIDFETLPDGGIPVDDQILPLGSTFKVDSIEVSIGFDTDDDRLIDQAGVFEAFGEDGTDAFLAELTGLRDTPPSPFDTQLGAFSCVAHPRLGDSRLHLDSLSPTHKTSSHCQERSGISRATSTQSLSSGQWSCSMRVDNSSPPRPPRSTMMALCHTDHFHGSLHFQVK